MTPKKALLPFRIYTQQRCTQEILQAPLLPWFRSGSAQIERPQERLLAGVGVIHDPEGPVGRIDA